MPLLLLLSLLQSPVPTLDGTITPGEWDWATHAGTAVPARHTVACGDYGW